MHYANATLSVAPLSERVCVRAQVLDHRLCGVPGMVYTGVYTGRCRCSPPHGGVQTPPRHEPNDGNDDNDDDDDDDE